MQASIGPRGACTARYERRAARGTLEAAGRRAALELEHAGVGVHHQAAASGESALHRTNGDDHREVRIVRIEHVAWQLLHGSATEDRPCGAHVA